MTSLATDGVFYGEATESTNYKALIFDKVSNQPIWSFGLTLQAEESLWALKAFCDRDSNTAKSPLGLGEEIINAAITAVGQTLTLTGGVCLGVMRWSDLPEVRQVVSDRNVWMTGVLLRIWVTDDLGASPAPGAPPNLASVIQDEVDTIDKIAAQSLGGNRVVYQSSATQVDYVDNQNLAQVQLVLGITQHAADALSTVAVQISGEMTDVSWSWTTGGLIFAGANGVLTQTANTTGFLQRVGIALSATVLKVEIHDPIILS